MLKTTMKFRIIILFFLSLTLDSLAQRCGGHFNFRIYDQKSKVLTPSLADTIFYASENLNKKKLTNDVNIKNIDGSYGIGFTSLYSSSSLFFNFSTGCHLPIKTVSIEKNNQKMILSFCNIEPEWEFVMDSIPFRPGVWKYDISRIVDTILKLKAHEGDSNKYQIWGYIIPFDLIKNYNDTIVSDIKKPNRLNRWHNTKVHSNSNGLNISYSNQIHSAIEIGYTKYLKSIVKTKVNGSIGGFDNYEDYTFAYWNAGSSLDFLLSKNFIMGPRFYSNFTYGYFSSQLNITAYTDFKTIFPVITPEIGVGRFIGLRYGYNLKLNKDTYSEIGNHKITVFINLKFGFPSLRHAM